MTKKIRTLGGKFFPAWLLNLHSTCPEKRSKEKCFLLKTGFNWKFSIFKRAFVKKMAVLSKLPCKCPEGRIEGKQNEKKTSSFSIFSTDIGKKFWLAASKLHSTCPEDFFQGVFCKKMFSLKNLKSSATKFYIFCEFFFSIVVKTAFHVSRRGF